MLGNEYELDRALIEADLQAEIVAIELAELAEHGD